MDPLPAELPGKPSHLIYLPPTLPTSEGVSAPWRLNPSLRSLYPFSLHVLQDITMCVPQILQRRTKNPKVSFNSTSSTIFFSSLYSPGYISPVHQDSITSSAKDTNTPLLINPKGFPPSSCSVWYSDYSLLLSGSPSPASPHGFLAPNKTPTPLLLGSNFLCQSLSESFWCFLVL